MTDWNPDNYEDMHDYAAAIQAEAVADADRSDFAWAIGGTAPDEFAIQIDYAIEPMRGDGPHMTTDELYDAIENLPSFRGGARIIKRQVSYGPWEYVTPEEITQR